MTCLDHGLARCSCGTMVEMIQSMAPPTVSIGFHNHLARFSLKVIAVVSYLGQGLVTIIFQQLQEWTVGKNRW